MIDQNNTELRLLPDGEKPDWFVYPSEFLRLVETELKRFPPWKIMDSDSAKGLRDGLRKRYPQRDLVPFALRLDCDDVACWEKGKLPKVSIIHDFASPGWEQRQEFDTFWAWFRSAINDFIEFEP
jgi:hypothetical protein